MDPIVIILIILGAAVLALVSFFAGIVYRKRVSEREIGSAEQEATRIINEAIRSGESRKKELLLEAKDEIHKSRTEHERDVKERRAELSKQERRLQQKEETLDKKAEAFERKEEEYAKTHGTINGHEYVDLGLPSGLKWATCNVGAGLPEEYGDYYAWGEVKTKNKYTADNSKTYGKSKNDISGNSNYDVARAKWGGNWRMPTMEELEELNSKCTWQWTTQKGINGYKVTGPNGNSIFLPAAGCREGSSLYSAGEYGFYWSSSPHESSDYCAFYLNLLSSGHGVFWMIRNTGQSVRPVSE